MGKNEGNRSAAWSLYLKIYLKEKMEEGGDENKKAEKR